MKIAALALASALAAAGFAQPSFAQQNSNQDQSNQFGQQQYGQQQYGQGMQDSDEDQGPDNRNWQRGGNWRNDARAENNENNENDGWRRMHQRMERRMGGMWQGHHRGWAQNAREGATFRFGNGQARMVVHCPGNESIQNCVQGATQLLDKIANLKSNTAASSGTNGSGSTTGSSSSGASSGTGTMSIPSSGPIPTPSTGTNESGQ